MLERDRREERRDAQARAAADPVAGIGLRVEIGQGGGGGVDDGRRTRGLRREARVRGRTGEDRVGEGDPRPQNASSMAKYTPDVLRPNPKSARTLIRSLGSNRKRRPNPSEVFTSRSRYLL